MKHDSFCIMCKKPAAAPKGNYNVNLVTLCTSKKCRRQRKSELQRERRRQMVMKFTEREVVKRKDSRRKAKFFGQNID